jgi:DNA-3-methyladenine glycosylase II
MLPVKGAFHLEGTVRLLQRRAANPVERWEDGRHLRVLRSGERLALVAVENRGTVDQPRVHADVVEGDDRVDQLDARLRRLHGLDATPFPIESIARAVPAAAPLMQSLRGVRPPRFDSFFEAVLNTVSYQQVSLEAAIAITTRLVERFGDRLEWSGRTWLVWPSPEKLAEASVSGLKSVGLSGAKAETIHRIARDLVAGRLRPDELDSLSSAEASERLCELQGIGPWTAHLILLRGFGRVDAFPPGDAGVARGLATLFGPALATPAACVKLARTVPDVGGYLYFLALAGQLLNRGLISPAQ